MKEKKMFNRPHFSFGNLDDTEIVWKNILKMWEPAHVFSHDNVHWLENCLQRARALFQSHNCQNIHLRRILSRSKIRTIKFDINRFCYNERQIIPCIALLCTDAFQFLSVYENLAYLSPTRRFMAQKISMHTFEYTKMISIFTQTIDHTMNPLFQTRFPDCVSLINIGYQKKKYRPFRWPLAISL